MHFILNNYFNSKVKRKLSQKKRGKTSFKNVKILWEKYQF